MRNILEVSELNKSYKNFPVLNASFSLSFKI